MEMGENERLYRPTDTSQEDAISDASPAAVCLVKNGSYAWTAAALK